MIEGTNEKRRKRNKKTAPKKDGQGNVGEMWWNPHLPRSKARSDFLIWTQKWFFAESTHLFVITPKK